MQAYPEVPTWWYAACGVISFAIFCVSIEIFPTQLPIWAAVFGVIFSAIISVPLAMLQAITNQEVGTNVIDEVIAGYLLPGKPIANALFKTISFLTTNQAVIFAGDLKLGHYMKIPPRMMFSIQIIPTIVTCVWTTLIQQWTLDNVEGICTPQQTQGYVCPGTSTFASSSVIWGAVGAKRVYSIGAP